MIRKRACIQRIILDTIHLGVQQNNSGMNQGSVGVDPYAAASEQRTSLQNDTMNMVYFESLASMYSSLGGGYANYQQTSALANASQLASSLSGKEREDLVRSIDCWLDLDSRSMWMPLLARIYLSSLVHLQANSTKMMMHAWVNQHLLESPLSHRVVHNRHRRSLAVAMSWAAGSVLVGLAVSERRWVPMGHRIRVRNVLLEAYLEIMGSPVRTPVFMSVHEVDRLIVELKSRGTQTINSDIRYSIELYMFHWWFVFRIEVAFSLMNIEEEPDEYHVRICLPLCCLLRSLVFVLDFSFLISNCLNFSISLFLWIVFVVDAIR